MFCQLIVFNKSLNVILNSDAVALCNICARKYYYQYERITAKIESKRIIRKILLTTAEVAAFPTEAAPPLT